MSRSHPGSMAREWSARVTLLRLPDWFRVVEAGLCEAV
jgi:hypothetical protein